MPPLLDSFWSDKVVFLGPRLSGSPAYDEAARSTVERFQEWGLQDARLEPFGFGRAWTLDGLTAEMVAPRYMPLIGYAEGTSPSPHCSSGTSRSR